MFTLTIVICILVSEDAEPSCGSFKWTYPTMRICAETLTRGLHDNANYAGENDKLITRIFGECAPARPKGEKI